MEPALEIARSAASAGSAASSGDDRKRRAAIAALDGIVSGMKLGLGTGSTADQFVRALAEKVKDGLDIVGVPTSERTADLARSLGIRLATLEEEPALDVTIDGADELDDQLRLVKGGGGALLREKIVATASKRMVVIADDSKVVAMIGAFPLPIEVAPFGLGATERAIAALAARLGLTGPMKVRRAGADPYRTDGGHYIIDASFGRIPDPEALAAGLDVIAGVMGHGLFLGIASEAVIARQNDVIRLKPAGLQR
jgi:ribose 5-phosphate isomerase A